MSGCASRQSIVCAVLHNVALDGKRGKSRKDVELTIGKVKVCIRGCGHFEFAVTV